LKTRFKPQGRASSIATKAKTIAVCLDQEGMLISPPIVAVPSEDGYDGYFMIEGYEHSAAKTNFLGALWGDLNVTRNEIAFEGAANLHSGHPMSDAAG
jgi:hypothetical protein